jgi:MFS family permease
MIIWKVKGDWAECRGEKFDYIGSVIYGLSLVAVMYGFSQSNIVGVILILLGIAGMFLFLRWEMKHDSPIFNVWVFRGNKNFITANLASLITYTASSATAFLVNLFLQYIKGFSPDQAGLILMTQPIIQTAVAPFTGRLSDKIDPRLVASAGMGFLCVGLSLFALLDEASPLVQIFIGLAIMGIGFGVFVPPNTNAIMSSVTPKYYAVASSFTSTMRTIGQTLCMGIVMVVMAMVIGSVVMTSVYHPNFLASSQISFGVFAALCFAGIFASLYGTRLKKR